MAAAVFGLSVLCCLTMAAATTYTTEINGSTWSYTLTVSNDKTTTNATVTAVTPADGALVVPSAVDGYPVVAIGNNFGKSNGSITSVHIPDSVQTIGSGAFTWCDALGEIVLGDGLTSIGGHSYSYTDTDSSNGYEQYGAFAGCVSLTNIVFGSSLRTIGNQSFTRCTSLPRLVLPDSLTSLGVQCFFYATSLREVSVGTGLNSMGTYAFGKCTALKDVVFRPCDTPQLAIGDGVFYECTALENVTLSKAVTSIGAHAFKLCSALKRIDIPDSVTSISGGAFTWCGSLGEIVFGDGLTSIGGHSYSYTDTDSSNGYEQYGAFAGCVSLTNIVFGSSLRTIGNQSFTRCTSLPRLVLPDSLTSIGVQCFYWSRQLGSVTFGNRLASIGAYAFGGCPCLRYINFRGDPPTTVGNNAFNQMKTAAIIYRLDDNTEWPEIWRGYAVKPASEITVDADAPYDLMFYKRNNWASEFFLTGETGSTNACYRFIAGKPIYSTYGSFETWCDLAVEYNTNTLYVSGVSETWMEGWGSGQHAVNCAMASESKLPANLQNLAPGEYTATWVLNEPRTIRETNYANNSNSVTFVVVPSTLISFMSEDNIVATDYFEKGGTYETLPAAPMRQYYNFAGWFTEADGGDVVTTTSKVPDSPATLYAHWEIRPAQTNYVSGSVSASATWRTGDLYVIKDNLTIGNGVTVTIEPGVIVKFAAGKSLTVNSGGTLKVAGTRALPVVFTSIKDDANGGDTNGDGDATRPQAGDWARLLVRGTVTMDYCSLLYGSLGSGTDDILTIDGGTVRFSNGKMMNIGKYAVGLESGHFYMNNSVIAEAYCAFRHWPSDPIVNSVIYNCNRLSNNDGQKLYNCIVVGVNEDWDWSSGRGNTYKNCVFWNESGFGLQKLPGSATSVNGNIWANPLFVDPDRGDFRIAANSPCVDAGNGAYAPEKDYYGLERRDVGKVTDSGVPSANGNCPDIGIHEVLWDEDESPYDIAPTAVSIDKTTAKIGDTVKVSWTIQNLGTEDVIGGWHDAVSLVSASGQSVELGEVLTTYTLKRKMSMNVNGTFTIPALPEGTWYARVNTNNRRSNVPEGLNTTNNVLTSAQGVAISVAATPYADGASGTLSVGSSTVVKFTFPAGTTGQIARVNVPAGLSVSYGLGFMPQGAYASGTMTATENGEALFHVPAGTTEVYLVMDAAQSEGQNYSVSFEAGDLAIISVSPKEVSCDDALSQIAICGAGFDESVTVTLRHEDTVNSLPCVVLSPELILCNLGSIAKETGIYSVSVKKDDTEIVVNDGILVQQATKTGHIWHEFDMPLNVRVGRVYTGRIRYGNDGLANVKAPIFLVSDVMGTKLRFKTSDVWKRVIHLIGLGEAGSVIIQPGETFSVDFDFCLESDRGKIQYQLVDEASPINIASAKKYLGIDVMDERYDGAIQRFFGETGGSLYDNVLKFLGANKLPKSFACSLPDTCRIAIMNSTHGSGNIFGEIYNANGLRYVDVMTILLYKRTDVGFSFAGQGYTDKNGCYFLRDIEPGEYLIRIKEKDSSSECLTVVENRTSIKDIITTESLPIMVDASKIDERLQDQMSLFATDVETGFRYDFGLISGLSNHVAGCLWSRDWNFSVSAPNGTVVSTFLVHVNASNVKVELPEVCARRYIGMTTDESNHAISGVSVQALGFSSMTSSDGKFDLLLPQTNGIVAAFTHESYSTKYVDVEVLENNPNVVLFSNTLVEGSVSQFGIAETNENIFLVFTSTDDGNEYYAIAVNGRYSIRLPLGRYNVTSINGNNLGNLSIDSTDSKVSYVLRSRASIQKQLFARSVAYKSSDSDIAATAKSYQRQLRAVAYAFQIGLGSEAGMLLHHYLDNTGGDIYLGDQSMLASTIRTFSGAGSVSYNDVLNKIQEELQDAGEDGFKTMCGHVSGPSFYGAYAFITPLYWAIRGTKGTNYQVVDWEKLPNETEDSVSYIAKLGLRISDYYDFDTSQGGDDLGSKAWWLDVHGYAKPFWVFIDMKDAVLLTFPKDKPKIPEGEGGGDCSIRGAQSCDPNEMVGPEGTGEARYVQPGEWMNYTIYFENKTNATAAAQEVFVTNPLSEWLDWSTFEMGEVSFNNQIDIGLSGLNGGTSEVQMNGTNYAVRTVLGGGNDGEGTVAASGVAHWYMRIVDNSDETTWPADPYAGFLPPNDDTHCGEGHISYRIKVRDDAPRNVVITNSATIVFDYNAPIETDPAWWNTVARIHDVELEIDGMATNLTLIAGEPFGELPTPTVKPIGYSFDAWYTGEGGTGVKATPDAIVPTGDFTLYAHWVGVSYKVRFNANGGAGEMPDQQLVYDHVSCLSSNAYTYARHVFAGWATNETGEAVYADGAEVLNLSAVAGAAVDLYAQWADEAPVADFAVSELTADEGAAVAVKVFGGNPEKASSVKVYLTYNTATAADVNLAKGSVDGVTPRGGLKFSLTLKWAKGEIGEKTITIPVKADALVEGEELFTLQLAAANGVERGAQTVCTVRIADAQWPDGMTPEEAAARGLAALPSGATAVKDAAGVMTGYFTKKDKQGNVTAKAMPGYIFTGWYDAKGKKVGAKAALADKTRKSKKATPRFAVAYYLRGLADPANGGKVTGSGKYAAGKKVTLKATPKKNWTFEGWRLMVPVAAISAAAPAAGYVSKAKSLTVAVTNELTYLAMFKPYPKVTVAVDNAKGGAVKGAGSYLAGKTVTLTATPKKGYAFCGWFDADGNLVSLKASYKYKVTADGLALSASFKKENALAKPVLTWDATNLTVGVSYSAKPTIVGESLVSVTKVTGLSKGLTFKSGKVSGVPTVAKAVTAKVTVALKSNAKKTWSYSVKLNVSALPTWAVGTFKGKGTFGGKDADVTLTVGKTGKISGKFVAVGKQYPFTASSFAELDAQGVLRTAKGTLKYGTKTCKVEIAVAEGEGGGEAEVAVTGGVTGVGALVVP